MKLARTGIGDGALLAAAPVALVIVAIGFRAAMGEFSADPDYAYLMNALRLLQARSPTYVDHPGTTVQLVAALVAGAFWSARTFFNGNMSLVDDVVGQPELYLYATRLVFTALASSALFALGWRIRRWSGSLPTALMAQMSVFFCYPAMFFGLTEVGPEGLLLPFSLSVVTYLVPEAFPARSGSRLATALRGVSVGASIGACLATKTTAFPLLLLIFIFPQVRIRVVAAISVAIGAIVLTLPIAGEYPRILAYNLRILTHSGPWGTGEAAVVAPGELWTNTVAAFGQVPEIYLGAMLCFILVLLHWTGNIRFERFPLQRLFVICGVILLLFIVTIARQPRVHYLAAAAAIVCLANAGVVLFMLDGSRLRRIVGYAVVAALVASGFQHGARVAMTAARTNGIDRRLNQAMPDRERVGDCKIVYSYQSPAIPFKLFFGAEFAGSIYVRSVHQHYPDSVFYDLTSRTFDTDDGLVETTGIDDWIRRQGCVDLVSSPRENFAPEAFGISAGVLTPVERSQSGSGGIVVYRIDPPAPGQTVFVAPR